MIMTMVIMTMMIVIIMIIIMMMMNMMIKKLSSLTMKLFEAIINYQSCNIWILTSLVK